MLEACISFAGPTGQLLNYMGNCNAIQAPTIVKTGVGQYTVTFFTARCIDASKIASAIILVECQCPSGTGTVTNVIPSPTAVFNANACEYSYQVSFKIETRRVVPALLALGVVHSFVDCPVVMVSITAKNEVQQSGSKQFAAYLYQSNGNDWYLINDN